MAGPLDNETAHFITYVMKLQEKNKITKSNLNRHQRTSTIYVHIYIYIYIHPFPLTKLTQENANGSGSSADRSMTSLASSRASTFLVVSVRSIRYISVRLVCTSYRPTPHRPTKHGEKNHAQRSEHQQLSGDESREVGGTGGEGGDVQVQSTRRRIRAGVGVFISILRATAFL